MSHEEFPWDDPKVVTEMVRQGMQSEFWYWFRTKAQDQAKADMLELADPGTTEEKVGFLRGKIRAWNEALLLPQQLVAAYDYEEMAVPEVEDQDTPGTPRRLSPLTEEDEDDGQPVQGA